MFLGRTILGLGFCVYSGGCTELLCNVDGREKQETEIIVEQHTGYLVG
jgi:hypothetical protein